MGLYSCGNIELWDYIAVGTESTKAMHLWEHRAMGLYSCSNVDL